MIVRSSLLASHGFAHGFSTREGGVSAAPFDTLNLGRGVGDDAEAVAENHRRLARAVGYGEEGALFEVSQVHGAIVRDVGAREASEVVRRDEADALVARHAGAAVGVRTADCLPLLVADPESGHVAAIHAGWRGVVGGVVEAGVAALAPAGARARLVAAIGPHIRLASFEVGEDVAESIAASAPGARVIERRAPRPHVDLAAAVRSKLAALGVALARVDDVGGDSFAEAHLYFSHRRDAARSVRLGSAMVARAAT